MKEMVKNVVMNGVVENEFVVEVLKKELENVSGVELKELKVLGDKKEERRCMALECKDGRGMIKVEDCLVRVNLFTNEEFDFRKRKEVEEFVDMYNSKEGDVRLETFTSERKMFPLNHMSIHASVEKEIATEEDVKVLVEVVKNMVGKVMKDCKKAIVKINKKM